MATKKKKKTTKPNQSKPRRASARTVEQPLPSTGTGSTPTADFKAGKDLME